MAEVALQVLRGVMAEVALQVFLTDESGGVQYDDEKPEVTESKSKQVKYVMVVFTRPTRGLPLQHRMILRAIEIKHVR
jgi:hypothetical protein